MTRFPPRSAASVTRGVESTFEINDDGIIVRSAEGVEIVVPLSLKGRILHTNHHSLLAGHTGGSNLYHKTRNYVYTPASAFNCFEKVRKCPHLARNIINFRKNVTRFQRFPTKGLMTSACINVLFEFIKTQRHNEYLLVINHRFRKMNEISVPKVTSQFMKAWVSNCGPPEGQTADNGG